MMGDVAIGVLIGLVLARVVVRVGSVLAAGLWNAIAFRFASAWPKEMKGIPIWFSTVHEIVTNERLEP